jgi:hypothetical protein
VTPTSHGRTVCWWQPSLSAITGTRSQDQLSTTIRPCWIQSAGGVAGPSSFQTVFSSAASVAGHERMIFGTRPTSMNQNRLSSNLRLQRGTEH